MRETRQREAFLSSIVEDSPAERAGLRPGDRVVSANGVNVARSSHDDVVALIANSDGLLKLQVVHSVSLSLIWLLSSSCQLSDLYRVAHLIEEYILRKKLHMLGMSAQFTLGRGNCQCGRDGRIYCQYGGRMQGSYSE